MAGLADREAAEGVSESYQYVVGESAFHFTVDDGSIQLHDGRVQDPAVILTTDEETWAALVSGNISASSAVAAGVLTIAGDPQAAKRLGKIFSRDQMLAQAKAGRRCARIPSAPREDPAKRRDSEIQQVPRPDVEPA
jgi:putative sterol carrier protein